MSQRALNEIGEKYVSSIQQEFVEKGLMDTGAARDSISYKATHKKLMIEGLERVLFLEFGRRPGQPPPFNVIKEWVIRKLAPPEEAIYPITKTIVDKIAREGTDIFTDRAKGLQLELLLNDLNDELLELIVNFEALEITNGLIKAWET